MRGYPVREISNRLGVSTHSLYKWIKQFSEQTSKAQAVDHEAEKRELARVGNQTDVLMIDATHLKAHRTASSLGLKRGGRGLLIGLTKGGLNSKLHAVTDALGRAIQRFLTRRKRQRPYRSAGR